MRRAAVVLASAAGLAGAPAHANPTGPVVVSGQAAFAQQGGTLSVTNTPGTIINWQQFSIRPNETTRFIQQSATSAVLNRVVGGDPSMLLGTLQSNGRVFLINPSGILFGAGAQVSVAGLVASSLQLSNQDFLAGRLNFTGDPTQSAPVVNRGRIAADGGGQVVLVGAAVANKGVITAPNGDIVLAAGRSVRVTEVGAPEIQVEITAPADRPLNLSEVTSGGRGIYSGFVTNSGSLNANSAVVNAGGRVVLKASNGVQLAAGSTVSADGNAGGSVMVDAQQGAATVAGMISARGTDAAGGTVAVTGNSVALSGIAQIDASGASAGGSVMIGGDLHGAPINDGGTALGNSRITSVAPGAQIRADATAAGDGGKVVVWSDATTTFRGSISARGGAASGNGGTVEVSGKQSLTFHGSVDTRAPAGKTGTLLLDPANIVIQAGSSDGDDADGLGNSFAGSPSGTTGSVLAGDTTPTALFQSELEGIAATTNISLAATNSITINPLAGGNLNLAQTAGRSVSFQSGTFSMSGSDTITTAGGALAITTTSGGATIGSLAANGGAVTLDVAGASTVAGGISGTGTTLTKLGAGALTLQGISTYTGATTVSAGTLQLGTSNALANSGALIVNGGTFDIGANSQTLAGAQLASGSITGTSGTLTSTANFDLRSGTVSAILGGNVSVNKTTGGTVTLSGNNTYTGATNVNAGTLAVAANNALGTTAAGTTVANGATLDFQSVVYGTTETVAVNGGTIAASTGTSSFAGPITLGASSSATVAGTQLTLSGAIGDGGGGFGLTMTGTGKLVLGTTNTYTGTTNVNAGTLALGTSNSLASAGSLVVNGGTFDIGGLDQTFAGVQLASGAITGTTGTLTSNSNFDLRAGTASAILGGSVGLDKTTGGTATLSGNNTYSGATNVNAGTLAVGANNALGTTGAGTTVASGATLDFQNVAYGSAEPVTVNGGSLATSAGTSSFAGPVTLGTSSSVSVTGTQLTLSGVIGQSSGGLGLTKTGAGKLVLGATEAYTGNTTVSGGTLSLGASDLLVNTTSLVVSGGTFDIGANNQTFAGVQLASGSITGTSGTLTSNSNFDLRQGTASAILAGSAGVDKTTTGTVTLSGNNTYSGTTNVNAGTLSAAANNALGTTGAGTTVANGATLDFASVAYTSTEPVTVSGGTISTSSGTSSFNGAITLGASSIASVNGTQLTLSGAIGDGGSGYGLTKTGAGKLVYSALETYTGNTTVSAGTLAIGASNLLVATTSVIVSGGTFDIGAFDQTVAGVQLTSGSITGTSGTLTSTSNFDLRQGSVSAILGGSVGLDKTTNGTVTLSGNNTYTGATTVSAGTLAVAANNALGTTAAGTTVASGATLDFQNVAYGTAEAVTVNGGTLATSTGTSSFSGPITLGADSTASVTGTQLTLTGAISDSGGGHGLTKTGAGKVVLSGTNTYTGVTSVNAGTLALGASNSLASASSIVVNGGTFDVGSFDQTLAGVQLASGSITGSAGMLTSITDFDLRSGSASAILVGTIGVNKTTSGSVMLSGNNTYTGATVVNGGTLAITSNNALGTTAAGTTVASGATLDFQNVNYSTSEALTVNGGTIATSTGTSSFAGPVTLGANSTVAVSGTRLTLTAAIGEVSSGLGLTKTGTGTLVLSGTSTYTGVTSVDAGTVALGASNALASGSSLVVNGGTFDESTFNQTLAGVQLASGSITGTTGALTSTSNFDLRSGTASAILAGNVGADKITTGTVTLSGSNTYTGVTTVSVGTLIAANANALGDIGAGTTVTSGATLAINNIALAAEPVTLNGNGVGGVGALTGTGAASLAGNVTVNSASTIGVATAADSLALSGAIDGLGALTLSGSGTVTFSSTVGATTALASLTQNAATVLKLNGGLVRTSGDQNYNGAVTTNGATTLRTTANGNVNASGVVTATAGTLTLDTGAGNATFSNLLDDFSTVQVTSGGTVSLLDANNLTIGNASLGALSARALSGNLTLGGSVVATGSGNSIVLTASTNFINTAGASALDPGSGRWLVYSTNPASDTRGGLVYDFKQYNAGFGATVLGSGNGFLYTVAPSVTPALTGSVSKVYDGTTTATITPANYSFTGAIDGDTIALGNATNGTYDTRHVGSGKLVSVSGVTLAGASNGTATVYGYQLAGNSASANVGTITQANLTVTANNQTKTYGDTVTFAGTEFVPSGLQNGETIGSVTLTSAGAAAGAHVAGGPYPIVPSAATGGTFTLGDYSISYANGALTVNKAALTVTANDQTKAYGTPFTFAGSEFTSTALKNGETIGSVTLTSAGAASNASVAGSPYAIVPSAAAGGTFTPSDYAITYASGVFTVNPAGLALTITADNLSKTYGTLLVFTGKEFSASGLQNGETIGSVTMTSAGAAADAPVSATPYSIVPTAASGGTFTPSNYTITYVNGELTVNPAPLVIRADDKQRLPSVPNPTFTATYTGFQLGDSQGTLGGQLFFATTATGASGPGNYMIAPFGQTSSNYAISFVDGTLNVFQPSSLLEDLSSALFAALQRASFDDLDIELLDCSDGGAKSARSKCKTAFGDAPIPRPAR